MVRYLQNPLLDDIFHRQLRMEREIDFIFDEQEAKYLLKFVILEQQIQEAKNQLLLKEKQMQEVEKKEQEAALQTEEAEKQKQEAEDKALTQQVLRVGMSQKLARNLHQSGASIEYIMQETGLTRHELTALGF
jgi:septum formation inhibitor MinC